MIAVDTNILVYAHRGESPFHDVAAERIASLAESRSAWAIPWPCLHEFYAIATNVRILKPPSSIAQAVRQISLWLESPTVVLLHEGLAHWSHLQSLVGAARVSGGQVHDARIAAICLEHGVQEFWSADRDFNRFPQLNVRNPLVG